MNDFPALSPKAEWPSLSGKSERTRRRRHFLRRHFTAPSTLLHYNFVFSRLRPTKTLSQETLHTQSCLLHQKPTMHPPSGQKREKTVLFSNFSHPDPFCERTEGLTLIRSWEYRQRHCTSLYQTIQAQGFSVTRRWLKLSHSSLFHYIRFGQYYILVEQIIDFFINSW